MREIDAYCREKGIQWGASCWDEASVDFIEQFDVTFHKVASACLTDDNLLKHIRAKGRPVIVSTGMSNLDQIDHAVKILGKGNLLLMHSCSTYPALVRRIEPARNSGLAAAIRRAGGLFGPRDGNSLVGRGRGLGGLHGGTPYHAGSLDVGFRPGGLAGTQRHYPPGA